jgi:anti-sigma B factor antagonist
MAVHGIVVSVITAKSNKDVTILKVSGYLDTTTAGELENALYSLLNDKKYKIVVDLSGVTYISSAGWGIFIGEIKEIRNNGGDLKLAGMIPDVYEVFELLEFQSILESYRTREEAVDAFASNKHVDSDLEDEPAS